MAAVFSEGSRAWRVNLGGRNCHTQELGCHEKNKGSYAMLLKVSFLFLFFFVGRRRETSASTSRLWCALIHQVLMYAMRSERDSQWVFWTTFVWMA